MYGNEYRSVSSWIRVTEKMAEIAKHGLDLVEIKEVISKNGGTEEYILQYGKMKIIN